MGCCCSNPAHEALGAALFTLVINVPALFYTSVTFAYGPNVFGAGPVSIWAIATFAAGAAAGALGLLERLVGRWEHHEGTLKLACGVSALATVSSLVYTVWAPIVLAQSYTIPESRALAIGTFVLAAVALLIAPLGWSSVAYFNLHRALQRTATATAGPSKAEDVEMSLPRPRRGRSRRRSSVLSEKGRYARVGRAEAEGPGQGSAWESGSDASGFSSGEEEEREWEEQRRERKQRARRA